MRCLGAKLRFFYAVVPAFFLLLGCNVYHTKYTNLEEAVESKNRVKIVTDQIETYEFRSIEKNENGYVGVTRKKSETAKKMKGLPIEAEGKFLKFQLDESKIYGVYLKNKGWSNAMNIGVPIISAAGLLRITDKDFRPNIGN